MLFAYFHQLHAALTTDQKVLGLVSLNVLLEALNRWAIHMETLLRVLVPLGQFAVAVATVWFIVKRGRLVDKELAEKKKSLPPDEGD